MKPATVSFVLGLLVVLIDAARSLTSASVPVGIELKLERYLHSRTSPKSPASRLGSWRGQSVAGIDVAYERDVPIITRPWAEQSVAETASDAPVVREAALRTSTNATIASAQLAQTGTEASDDAGAPPTPIDRDAAYVDQLIGDEVTEAARDEARLDEQEPATGRRLLVLEYNLFREDRGRGASRTEHGMELRGTQETLYYGTIRIDTRAKADTVGNHQQDSHGEYFQLAQDNFVLDENWQMDTTLGDFSAQTHPLTSSSFRFSLGSSLARGLASTIYSTDTEIRALVGKVGSLNGTATRVFDERNSTLIGLGAVRRLSDNWTAGLQGFALRDNVDVADHQSVVGVAQYFDADSRTRHQLHALRDSTGNTGVWADGDSRWGRWHHRYGAFHLQPELLWTDTPIANDRRGLYWRADRRGFRRTWSFGTDVSESNIEGFSDRAGVVNATSFASLSWRLNRRTSVGAFGNLGLRHPGRGLDSESVNSFNLTTFIGRELGFGLARVQASYGENRGDFTNVQTYRLIWDQDWSLPTNHRLSTTVDWSVEATESNRISRNDFGLSYDYSFSSDFNVGVTASVTRLEADTTADALSTRADVSAFWEPRRNWQIQASASWNHERLKPIVGNASTSVDRRLFVTLRRVLESGRSPVTYGLRAGKSGSGRLIGRVFFDDNRDGRWSPVEPTAEGVVVYLDRRFTRTTDRDGRFEFAPVFVGPHAVTISQDNLPLPWGLDDETARVIEIGVRWTTELDFPLIRLDN